MTINIKFREISLDQVALSARLGGLGTVIAKDIAPPAFVSSLHAVRELVGGIGFSRGKGFW